MSQWLSGSAFVAPVIIFPVCPLEACRKELQGHWFADEQGDKSYTILLYPAHLLPVPTFPDQLGAWEEVLWQHVAV